MAERGKKLQANDFDLEYRTAYRFAVLSEMAMRSLAGMYTKKFGLTLNGWRALAIIGRYEPVFPSDVASRATMEADKVTRAVDQLVNRGWVARKADTADRRRVVLTLTRRGKAIFDEIDLARRVMETQFLSVLNGQELKAFYEVMAKLEAQARKIFTGKDSWKTILGVADGGNGARRARKLPVKAARARTPKTAGEMQPSGR